MTGATHRKTALITGASTGIGRELAELFAGDGYDLVIVARTAAALLEVAETLEKQHKIDVTAMAVDLSKPGFTGEIIAELGDRPIDVLVNNAGFGLLAPIAEADPEVVTGMMQLNMVSLVQLTRMYLPQMLERNSGRIMNVASTAAFQPGPFMSVYFASKSFVLSFSEAITHELKGTGVTVTALCPGPTRTEFGKRAGTSRTHLMKDRMTMDAASVARIGYRAMMKGKTTVVPGVMNKLLIFMIRFFPRKLPPAVAAQLVKLRK
jgi:short-subunit dehydrogenase